MGQEALDFLKDFSPPDCTPCFDISAVDQETFKGILQGTNFTAAVVKWFASCRWPPKVSKDYARKDDWGISWLELLFSFILFSRCHILGLQCSRGTFVACVNSCCFPDLFHVSAGHQNHHFGGHHPYHLFQKVLVSPSFQFFWYLCGPPMSAVFAKPFRDVSSGL